MSVHRSTESMTVLLASSTVQTVARPLELAMLMCCLRGPSPGDPGARGERVLPVGARGGGVGVSRHCRHSRVEEPDHAGPEPQLHRQHRRLGGEEPTDTQTHGCFGHVGSRTDEFESRVLRFFFSVLSSDTEFLFVVETHPEGGVFGPELQPAVVGGQPAGTQRFRNGALLMFQNKLSASVQIKCAADRRSSQQMQTKQTSRLRSNPRVLSLQHLYNLVHLDLSYNSLRVLEAAHTRLGNIKTLSLAGNQLERLGGLSKLYCLVNLDLSHNQLAQVIQTRGFRRASGINPSRKMFVRAPV